MLERKYRGHDIDGRSKESRHVLLSYDWFDALPPVRSFAKRRNGLWRVSTWTAEADEAESIIITRNNERARTHNCRRSCCHEVISSLSYA